MERERAGERGVRDGYARPVKSVLLASGVMFESEWGICERVKDV